MNKISNTLLSLVTIALLSACSSDSGTSTQELEGGTSVTVPDLNSRSITVVDGYVIGAVVKDSNGVVIGTTDGYGKVYIADDANLNYPLSTNGGVIDKNQNHIVDADDLELPSDIVFMTDKGDVVSPITTLLANGTDSTQLATLAGVDNIEDFYKDPILDNNIELEKINQIAYAIVVSDNINTFNYNLDLRTNVELPQFSDSTITSQTGSIDALGDVAIDSLVSVDGKNFVSDVLSLDVTDVNDIELNLETSKEQLNDTVSGTATIQPTVITTETTTTTTTTTQPTTDVATTTDTIVTDTITTDSTDGTLPGFDNPVETDTTEYVAGDNMLPGMNGDIDIAPEEEPVADTDLPNFSSEDIEDITTDTTTETTSTTDSALPTFNYN